MGRTSTETKTNTRPGKKLSKDKSSVYISLNPNWIKVGTPVTQNPQLSVQQICVRVPLVQLHYWRCKILWHNIIQSHRLLLRMWISNKYVNTILIINEPYEPATSICLCCWSLLYTCVHMTYCAFVACDSKWVTVTFHSAFLNIHRSGALTVLFRCYSCCLLGARSVSTIVSLYSKPHT